MTAKTFSRLIYLTKLPCGGVAISVDTDYRTMPALTLPTQESFTEFALAVQYFQNEMKADVPDVYK